MTRRQYFTKVVRRGLAIMLNGPRPDLPTAKARNDYNAAVAWVRERVQTWDEGQSRAPHERNPSSGSAP